jgi:uncharacterized protein
MEHLYIFGLTLLASIFGTVTGFGTSTILVPLLGVQFPLAQTLLFVGVIHWFGDIWKMMLFKRGASWKLIILFGIAGIAVSFMSARLAGIFPEDTLKRMLGGFLLTYVIFVWLNPRWKLPKTDSNALIGGGLSGFFAGLFGAGGAIRTTFLSAYNLDKSIFIFTSGAIGLLIDGARIVGYVTGGIRLSEYKVTTLIIAVCISLAGAYIAKLIVNKISQEKFRMAIAIALSTVGVRYLLF